MNWIELNEIRIFAEHGSLTPKQAGEHIGIIYFLMRLPNTTQAERERLADVALALHKAGATIPADTTTEAFIKKHALDIIEAKEYTK
jgi:hypothetical protein